MESNTDGKRNSLNSKQKRGAVYATHRILNRPNPTSEISALMFSIILIWSWGILTEETPRDERLVSGTKDDELEASAALSLISGLEELEAGSSLAALNIDI